MPDSLGIGAPYRFEAVGQDASAVLSVDRRLAKGWIAAFERNPKAMRMWIRGQGKSSIAIPYAACGRILYALVRGSRAVQFSLDDVRYPGAVRLAIVDGCSDEFEFTLETDMVECTDAGCQHDKRLVSKDEWDMLHYPHCRSHKLHSKIVRAGIVGQVSVVHLAGAINAETPHRPVS